MDAIAFYGMTMHHYVACVFPNLLKCMHHAINLMDKLLNDPSVMEQCAKLLANPSIMRQMSELMKNPDKVASLTEMLLSDQHLQEKTPKHPCGTKIRTCGLSTVELNGLTGDVVSYDKSTERYVVQLDGPESRKVSLKEINCTQEDVFEV
jgi:hypothetical protein